MDLDPFCPFTSSLLLLKSLRLSLIVLVPISLFSKLLCRSLGMTVKMLNKNLIFKLTLDLGFWLSIWWPSNTTPRYLCKWNKKLHSHKNLSMNVDSSCIYNCQIQGERLTNRGTGRTVERIERIVVYLDCTDSGYMTTVVCWKSQTIL